MKEEILTFIWRNKLFPQKLTSIEGKNIQIIDFGQPSVDSGPDFINVKLIIDDKLWIGSVEMHVKASDWYKHKHDTDLGYKNVILHIVLEADISIYRSTGELIPTVQYNPSEEFIKRYKNLISKNDIIKCNKYLHLVPSLITLNYLDSLFLERLQQKAENILQTYHSYFQDWEQVIFINIAKYLGSRINSFPMELLAKSLSIRMLRRYTDNIEILEAILFGVAGFLDEEINDKYLKKLREIFGVYKVKHNLKRINRDIWKFMRMRPSSFPTIRIAQLAMLISKTDQFFSLFLEKKLQDIRTIFRVSTSQYWQDHYIFGKLTSKKIKNIGESMINNLLLNAVVPVIFAYALYFNDKTLNNRAIEYLTSLKFEKNYITRRFQAIQIKNNNASHSQALIHLYKNYCLRLKCLECRIGTYLLNKSGELNPSAFV